MVEQQTDNKNQEKYIIKDYLKDRHLASTPFTMIRPMVHPFGENGFTSLGPLA
jgi:hypothetical protein